MSNYTPENSSARQRSSVQTMDREEMTAMGTTPSALEQGATPSEKQLTEDGGDNTVAKPRRRGQRLREFKQRVRGKHLEHIPTFKECLIATVRQSCTSQGYSISPAPKYSHSLPLTISSRVKSRTHFRSTFLGVSLCQMEPECHIRLSVDTIYTRY
jgi:hypothetical protein